VPRWSAVRSLGLLLVTVLIGALALSPAPARADGADATPTSAAMDDTPTPDDSSTPVDDSPTPTPTDDEPESPTPPPQSPTPGQPVPSATTAGPEPGDGNPVLQVRVYASNAVLGAGYWTGADATSFTITVRNTGTVTATVKVNYTVPAGVTDTATGACQHGSCAVPSIAPGASVPLPVAITVSPDAWRSAPLTGQLAFTASATDAPDASGRRTWGIVFPPGPPAPGIGLQVDDVTMDARPDVPGQLKINVTNSGSQPAATTVDVVVPDGVSPGPMPACQSQQRLNDSTTRCALGMLPAGGQQPLTVPLTVDAQARANAPLAGLVRATLTPSGQAGRTTQASYQILVPVDQIGVSAGATASGGPTPKTGSQDGPFVLSSHSAAAWPIITASTAVLIAVIVGLVLGLRARPVGAAPRFARGPAVAPAGGAMTGGATSGGATSGAAAAGQYRSEPVPETEVAVGFDGFSASGLDGTARSGAEPDEAEPESGSWSESGSGSGSTEPIRAEQGEPIEVEWTELPGSTPPAGLPVTVGRPSDEPSDEPGHEADESRHGPDYEPDGPRHEPDYEPDSYEPTAYERDAYAPIAYEPDEPRHEATGANETAPTANAPETNASETNASETNASEATRAETNGPETTGPAATGPETTGPETNGPEANGAKKTGAKHVRTDEAAESLAEAFGGGEPA
jgi:hypothetical protein